MRIVLISFGGHAYYPHMFIDSMMKIEKEVLAFVPEDQRNEYREITSIDKNFSFYKKPRMRNPGNLLTIHSMVRSIRKFNPDVIHLFEYYPWMYFFIKSLSDFPLVLTVHDPVKHTGDITSKIIPGSERNFYRYVDHIITLGHHTKRLIIEKDKIEESMITVIPHGNYEIYLNWKRPETLEKDKCILFLGRIYRYKGLEFLISAAKSVIKILPDTQIIIAGTGSSHYLQKIRNQVKDTENFIFFNKFLTDEEIARLFQQASLLVLPYIDGTQSGPLMISYAFKKPVVATRVGNFPEYIADGSTGFLVEPRNITELSEKILELLTNDNLRKKMGVRAFEKSNTDFSWERVAIKTLKVYKKTLH